LSDKDFYCQFKKVEKVINNVLEDSISLYLSKDSRSAIELNNILKRCNSDIQGIYSDIIMDNYGDEVIIDGISLFKLTLDSGIVYLDVTTSFENNRKINEVIVREFINGKVNTDVNNNYIK